MKKVALILVGVFEIICGISGEMMVLGGLIGISPYESVPLLWYGLFPLLSAIAGIMLLLKSKFAFELSAIVLLLQIPFIYVAGISVLRVGVAFNIYLTAIWNARAGANATVLGFNFLALVVLIALVSSRSELWRDADTPKPDDSLSIWTAQS